MRLNARNVLLALALMHGTHHHEGEIMRPRARHYEGEREEVARKEDVTDPDVRDEDDGLGGGMDGMTGELL